MDGGVALGDLVDGFGPGGDEAVSADLFSADDAFEKEGVLLSAEDFKGCHWGETIGEELAVDGDDFGATGGGGKFSDVGEIAAHGGG